ncbi:218aa long hypothetical protein [Pyrococcus horikoshii OT3]|uniref:Uncharacterized protein n=2 Tax=Pyrococcus horikoshii TaxID=53953 RepID=O50130_PYRHO|nr:218aa long hypothetical protein [Pyrococcus horikoshii OT3]
MREELKQYTTYWKSLGTYKGGEFMDIKFLHDGVIILENKTLNKLDEFVIDAISILERYVEYVIVSGYVAILFGRARGTEDIDTIISRISFERFKEIYDDFISSNFEFLNGDDPQELYEMLQEGLPLRISKSGRIFPNLEIKFPKNELHLIALKERILVKAGQLNVYISPIELQIAYKLYLGSDRDYEDAYFLYELFKDAINKEKLEMFCRKLGVNPIE